MDDSRDGGATVGSVLHTCALQRECRVLEVAQLEL